MNKFLLAATATVSFALSASLSAVEIHDGEYEKQGEISFIVKQGEVTNKVSELFSRLYPNTRVVFKQKINGYLPADIEVSGSDRSVIALEVLAGLGLSACHYENNIVEVGKFKKKGICPTVRMKNARYPKIKKLGDGVLSFTNEWFGKFDPVGYSETGSMAMNASYIQSSDNFVQGDTTEVIPEMAPIQLMESAAEDAKPVDVAFEFTSGLLFPQVNELVGKLENSPKLVWELDGNTQWFNKKKIIKPTYEEILATVLESYDAFADVYENDVVVIRLAEGME